MEISKEVIIDILENLSDDELRLFLEHLVNNNSFAKESLYKYYQGLMNNKYIEKINYKERILEEIKVDKIHPYAFVSFYDLLNNSLIKFDKNNDDFLYELLFEAYIELSKKYSKVDFSDLFDYLNNINTPLESKTLEVIISKIYSIKNNKLSLKIDVLTKLLKYVNKNDISIYLDCFYEVYEVSEDKSIYLSLIDYLFSYFQRYFSKIKAIQFLEYFVVENYRINHTVVAFYKNNEDYEKAVSILNKVNASKLNESEYKDYLINKGSIYKELGSNKLYFKSLVDLILHNHFEYFEVLKYEQQERDFLVSLDFIVDNLNIQNGDLSILHDVLRSNLCDYGLIKFYDKYSKDLIYEDILYFRDFDLNKATSLYMKHILELTKDCNTRPKLNALILHLIDLKREYKVKDFNKFLNELKPYLSDFSFEFIYSSLLREFPR